MTTSVADTGLLLTLEFPPDANTKAKIERLVQEELAGRLLIPVIVLTEFVKVAGSRIGLDAALTRIRILKSRGAKIIPVDEELALVAGKLLLSHPTLPMPDALVASVVHARKAEYVLSNDSHFKAIGVKSRWI